jgi:hypothetical protein
MLMNRTLEDVTVLALAAADADSCLLQCFNSSAIDAPSEGTRWGLNGRGGASHLGTISSGFPCLRSLLIGLTILSPGSLEALRWWFWLLKLRKG